MVSALAGLGGAGTGFGGAGTGFGGAGTGPGTSMDVLAASSSGLDGSERESVVPGGGFGGATEPL
jgi:hypothetical protein